MDLKSIFQKTETTPFCLKIPRWGISGGDISYSYRWIVESETKYTNGTKDLQSYSIKLEIRPLDRKQETFHSLFDIVLWDKDCGVLMTKLPSGSGPQLLTLPIQRDIYHPSSWVIRCKVPDVRAVFTPNRVEDHLGILSTFVGDGACIILTPDSMTIESKAFVLQFTIMKTQDRPMLQAGDDSNRPKSVLG